MTEGQNLRYMTPRTVLIKELLQALANDELALCGEQCDICKRVIEWDGHSEVFHLRDMRRRVRLRLEVEII